MKKILGLIAVALLLGGPAFAANTSRIDFTVKVGGDNQASVYEAGNIPQFTGGQTTLLDGVGDTVTWSVSVAASGMLDDATSIPLFGVANLVFTLELYDSSNNLVQIGAAPMACGTGGPLGDASCKNAAPTGPGFYSTINDGDADGPRGGLGADPYHLASFVYGVEASGSAPLARIIDQQNVNGPELLRAQYPSSNGATQSTTVPISTDTRTIGRLVGMGAGYEQFKAGFLGGTQTAGVGLGLGDPSGCALGTPPVAEGQISLKTLAGGTYTLKVVPGTGNNVLGDPTGAWICSDGTTGRFAVAAATTAGSQVQFVHIGPTTGNLTVTIAGTIPAGGAWTVDGATFHNSGDTVALPAGNYTVSAKAVAGFVSPGSKPAVVTSSGSVTVALDAYGVPPALVSAASMKSHNVVPGPVKFGITLNLTAGGAATSECRKGGPTEIAVTYDKTIGGTPVVTAVGATVGAVTMSGAVLTIPLSGAVDRTCVAVTINGVADPANLLAVAPAATIKVRAMQGDFNNSGSVNATDITVLKAQSSPSYVTATTALYDYDLSGKVNATDVTAAKPLSAPGSVTCNN